MSKRLCPLVKTSCNKDFCSMWNIENEMCIFELICNMLFINNSLIHSYLDDYKKKKED